MNIASEKVVLIEPGGSSRESLQEALQSAGHSVTSFATSREGLDFVHQSGADLLILDLAPGDSTALETLAAIRGAASTESLRVLCLVSGGAAERAAALNLGADDVLSRPLDTAEFLARASALLRARRREVHLNEKTRIAEEGQQIAHTAFEALAVTEKMTSDAFSLDRRLKIGFAAVFAVAIVMAGIYFLFAGSAHKENQRTDAMIARLEGGLLHQQDLIAQVRKLRSEQGPEGIEPASKDELQKQAADLKAKMAAASSDEIADLQKQLAETDERLKRVESEDDAAQTLIPTDVRSVCLLHVAVAFRNQQSWQRLRYAGLNPQGEPLQDSGGNPILTLEGRGPEVMLDVFGTGFLVGAGGRVLTNRHVSEPWWKNDEISGLTNQGFQAEISSIHAYFPGDPRAFTAEIQDISKDADLATMRVDMQDLKRGVLTIDPGAGAAVPGEPIVSMGYATGLAAILARTDEDTAQKIVSSSGGDVSQVLGQLAHRGLIRPLITQGHIGDILADKIVFDAQTTSGGSGGPLINHQGKVIGVTFAVLKGFGGSNFGIPIKFSAPLLSDASTR
ncbi:MAG: trypsin-like peptidase domain-containing protein [Candidatus Acidiferrales bacterium]